MKFSKKFQVFNGVSNTIFKNSLSSAGGAPRTLYQCMCAYFPKLSEGKLLRRPGAPPLNSPRGDPPYKPSLGGPRSPPPPPPPAKNPEGDNRNHIHLRNNLTVDNSPKNKPERRSSSSSVHPLLRPFGSNPNVETE